MAPPSAPVPAPPPGLPPEIGTAHCRRLREVWRSAGWPFQDLLEVQLLVAGLLARERDGHGRDTVRVTDAGIAVLAATLQKNRTARDAHEHLVARVAREMQRAGRVVWRGLSLRARVGESTDPTPAAGWVVDPGSATTATAATTTTATTAAAGGGPRWAIAMPDVFSIRHTTVEDYVEPVVHEVKVQRADLLADLRRPAKGEAYRWLSGECWYVLRAGIAQPAEIPDLYGVMLAEPGGALVVARSAPRRGLRLPFAVWMALARATPEPLEDDAQQALGGGNDQPPGWQAPPGGRTA